jgi:hypothetical protein
MLQIYIYIYREREREREGNSKESEDRMVFNSGCASMSASRSISINPSPSALLPKPNVTIRVFFHLYPVLPTAAFDFMYIRVFVISVHTEIIVDLCIKRSTFAGIKEIETIF